MKQVLSELKFDRDRMGIVFARGARTNVSLPVSIAARKKDKKTNNYKKEFTREMKKQTLERIFTRARI